ncbi:MAG: DUF2807 domain-containing protein [Sphingobacteriia bacterium]|nr:DUF2807 domain-containing protein [Sphingobacteriia bacterium]
MKKLLALLFSLATLAASAQWGNSERVTGNGNLKKETRSVANFSAVASAGSMNVQLIYGKPGSVTVEAEENLLEYIETKVENNTLKIGTRNYVSIRTNKKITVYVTMARLEGVSVAGSGNIDGSGDFGNEGKTWFRIAGSGNINLSFDRIKQAEIGIAGSGKVILKGKAEQVNVNISGSGNVECTELVADRVKVNVTGSGNTRVHADQSLEVSVLGSGDVYYKGNARDIVKHAAGSGKVTKL